MWPTVWMNGTAFGVMRNRQSQCGPCATCAIADSICNERKLWFGGGSVVFRLFSVSLVLLVAGCAAGSIEQDEERENLAEAVEESVEEPVVEETEEPLFPPSLKDASDSVVSLPVDECRLPKTIDSGPATGFPRDPELLPASGELSGLMVFVEFDDVAYEDDRQAIFDTFVPGFVDFYKANSGGRLSLMVEPMADVVSIAKASTAYGMDVWAGGDLVQYFFDGVRAASEEMDISPYDFFIIMPPSDAEAIAYGPAYPGEDGSAYGLESEELFFGVAGGAAHFERQDLRWIWLAHEFGHLLGMTHQYNNREEGIVTPVWDLMDSMYITTGPGLLGWHRFQLGWFDDAEVRCFNQETLSSNPEILLSGLESEDGEAQLAIIRTGDTSALVIEGRLDTSYNSLPEHREGIVVYGVDTSRDRQFPGHVRMLPFDSSDEFRTLRPGPTNDFSLATEFGTTVEVNERFGDTFLVRLTPSP
jgi:M6 family metalloprotease-like protein